MSRPEAPVASPSQSHNATGCLVRIVWMVVGNAVLAILAVFLSGRRGFVWSHADTAYWAVVVGLVALRWVDVRILKGETATGEPATVTHWKRYALLLPIIALLVWAVAHAMAWLR